jgi:hypothetical protein
MTKLLIGILSLALLGAGGVVAAVEGFDSEPVRSVILPDATTGHGTTTEATTDARTTTGGDTAAATTAETTTTERNEDGDDRRRGRGRGSGHDDRSGSEFRRALTPHPHRPRGET